MPGNLGKMSGPPHPPSVPGPPRRAGHDTPGVGPKQPVCLLDLPVSSTGAGWLTLCLSSLSPWSEGIWGRVEYPDRAGYSASSTPCGHVAMRDLVRCVTCREEEQWRDNGKAATRHTEPTPRDPSSSDTEGDRKVPGMLSKFQGGWYDFGPSV